MSQRAHEIESFFWLVMSLLGTAFGYLMMVGGGLFALVFLQEKLRTGAVTLGGAVHADEMTAVRVIVLPALVAVLGWAMVRWIAHRRRSHD